METTNNTQEKKGRKKKLFMVTGWVELSIFAQIEAYSLKEAKQKIEDGNVNWEDNAWESEVKDLEIKETKEDLYS